jgi:uncharacterized membrane protein YdjX (TVP38/TMEM64 family)
LSGAEVQAENQNQPAPWRLSTGIRAASLIVIGASLLMLVRDLPLTEVAEAIPREVAGLGGWAPLVFGLLYVLAALLFFPASVLTITAGALFGLLLGTVMASTAATTSVALSFLVGRYLARDAVLRLARRHPRLAAVDRAVSADGWKVVALLRLTPAVSFALQNYLYGATGIRFGTCVLTSAVAMLPGTLLYVYMGALGREAVGAGSPAKWALLAVGLLATLALTVYITRLARRALRGQGGATPLEAAEPASAPGDRSRPWITLALVAVALVLAAAAAFAHFQPEKIEHFLRSAPAAGPDGGQNRPLARPLRGACRQAHA